MSSFIVSDRCMNNIIKGLFWTHEFKRGNSILERNGLSEFKDFLRLAKDLYALNARGTGQRYNDKQTLKTIYKFKYDEDQPTPNKWQVLKSLHCLRYQCMEGDTEQQELYKFLDDIISCWQSFCIGTIKEYNSAEWN